MTRILCTLIIFLLSVTGITLLWYLFYRFFFFLRDPKRVIPPGNNIVASADGYILYIKEINGDEVPFSVKKGQKIILSDLLDKKRDYNLLIGIFMTPISVHYNRFPFSGKVTDMIYKKTSVNEPMATGFCNVIFNLPPFTKDANFIVQNERHITILENDKISCAIVQIADKWVNKIVNYCKIGDRVTRGDKLGLIKMGSQCDLFLKIKGNYKIKVKERDYVKAGTSVLIDLE